MGAVAVYLSQARPADGAQLAGLDQARREALLKVVALAIYADGIAAVEELEISAEVLREIPCFARCDDAELDALVDAAASGLRQVGESGPVAQAEYRRIAEALESLDLREAAFGLAVVISVVDGVVVHPERGVLKALIQALELSRSQVISIAREAQSFVEGWKRDNLL